MSNVTVLPVAPVEISEPDWEMLLPDGGKSKAKSNARWREVAREEWKRVLSALRSAGTLAPENRHQMQRLVVAYVRYDRAASEVFKAGGPITKSRTGVPMLNQWQVEMRQADDDATKAEMELGIPPRRRGSVAKTKRQAASVSKADAYLNTKRPGA